MRKCLKVGLDVDEVISEFMRPYLERFGTPKNDAMITRICSKVLSKDKQFWMNVPLLHIPDFKPTLFCSKRVHNKKWSKEYLAKNLGITDVPFYQVYCQTSSKAPYIKGRCDVFIDDSPSNFMDLNSKGIRCLLMDSPYNKSFNTPLRIYSLHYDEIEYMYYNVFGYK